MKQQSSL